MKQNSRKKKKAALISALAAETQQICNDSAERQTCLFVVAVVAFPPPFNLAVFASLSIHAHRRSDNQAGWCSLIHSLLVHVHRNALVCVKQLVDDGCDESPTNRGNPVHPEGDERATLATNACDQLHARGYCGVKRATAKAANREAGRRQCHANGKAVEVVRALPRIADVQDDRGEGEGVHHLTQQRLPDAQQIHICLRCGNVQTDDDGRVEGGAEGAGELYKHVKKSTPQRHLAVDEDGEGDGRVEVGTTDVAKGKAHRRQHKADGERGESADTDGGEGDGEHEEKRADELSHQLTKKL